MLPDAEELAESCSAPLIATGITSLVSELGFDSCDWPAPGVTLVSVTPRASFPADIESAAELRPALPYYPALVCTVDNYGIRCLCLYLYHNFLVLRLRFRDTLLRGVSHRAFGNASSDALRCHKSSRAEGRCPCGRRKSELRRMC